MNRFIYFIHDIILLFYAILAKIFLNRFEYKKNYSTKKKNNKTIIIANGPSLKNDMKYVISQKKKSDFYCVNYFASHKEFKIIKPKYYAFSDPLFWRKDVNVNYRRNNIKLYKNLLKINWQMILLCPYEGADIVSQKLKKNKFIRVIPVKTNFFNFKTEKLNVFALSTGIATPMFINVLILSLWDAIKRELPHIEIYGADFSAFKELEVNQKTNKVSSKFSHFYKNTKAESNAGTKFYYRRKKLHQSLYSVWIAFYQMYLLSIVAKKYKIKVVNCSSNSYLDIFERQK